MTEDIKRAMGALDEAISDCWRTDDDCDALKSAAAAERAEWTKEVERLIKLLADCYRASGADPDDNEDWRLAGHAVEEVKRLRAENDELRNEFATASDLAASRMHTCPRCGFRAALSPAAEEEEYRHAVNEHVDCHDCGRGE